MRPACCHSRRLSESRMRENLTYGLMRGRRKRAVGLLDRDTHPKGEKRPGVAGPATVPRRCPTLRMRNVLDKLPMKRQAEARSLLTKIPYAETRDDAERQKRAFQAWCTSTATPRRTSNPIESTFAA